MDISADVGKMKLSQAWKAMIAPVDQEIDRLLCDNLNCGPFNGGCLIIAQAIQATVGGDIVPLVDNEDYALHAVVLKDGMLWDYDGPLEPESFLDRYNSHVNEDRYRCVGYREFRAYDLVETVERDDLAEMIASLLERALPLEWKKGNGIILRAKRPDFAEIEYDDPRMSVNPFKM